MSWCEDTFYCNNIETEERRLERKSCLFALLLRGVFNWILPKEESRKTYSMLKCVGGEVYLCSHNVTLQ